jgi:hypothetical protein
VIRGALSEIFTRAPDDALRAFLRRWHDVSDPLEDVPVPPDTPPALRRLHQVDAVAPRFFADNHLLSAAQRTRAATRRSSTPRTSGSPSGRSVLASCTPTTSRSGAARTPPADREPYRSVWLGALTEDAIRFVVPHLSDAWEYCSLWLP